MAAVRWKVGLYVRSLPKVGAAVTFSFSGGAVFESMMLHANPGYEATTTTTARLALLHNVVSGRTGLC